MADGLDRQQATAWFDVLYQGAGRDARAIPWAHLQPNPDLVAWLDGAAVPPGTALVVGCGLGDDAEELARRGWEVAAFDAAPTAIQWAVDRFPGSAVEYQVADLFHLPTEWHRAFDLVVDVRTIQSLPPHLRDDVIAAIAAPVASGGRLLAVAWARPDDREPAGPPWPLSRRELLELEAAGLELVTLDDRGGEFFAEFARP